ncbi:PstS family phosphate ABC transporter substrate-binding protein [Thermaerobacter composti]|uniref:Phosphate-binding protein n=1 Tax=Thermaerobacter composti TaxID=554949 RepID=A0ABZ0QNM6_9FIRM|nr:PstS family phosphate ABC transporter substrate-binding protein [Thermaerobacter composti]WPD18377.1 PstS family phosphate ABC transporter substrate-binding protein [Thermaerobacter composti]
MDRNGCVGRRLDGTSVVGAFGLAGVRRDRRLPGRRWTRGAVAATLAAALVLGACGGGGAGGGEGGQLSGTITIDGSSTVYPITQAVAEEFMAEHPGVNVTVGVSGTGGGFQKFTRGEIEISNASRPIEADEQAAAEEAGIEYTELQVALDGIAVVVNPQNDWVDHLTVEELKRIWEPNSTVRTWRDVRPEWPDEPIRLYGPGTDSGTFDYFTEAVVGEEGASRTDYTASEDDNQLVTGVANDKYALGYFGFAYYVENRDKLRAVPIDGGRGPVEPTEETIASGSYTPLSRPLFIYVNNEAYRTRPEVRAFVDYYLEVVGELAPEVGYIPLPDEVLAEQVAKLEALR